MSKITPIGRPYCQKVLPLVYDDSLSYYEMVCKLTAKINEVINEFTDYSEVIEELRQGLTQIEGMKQDIDTLKSDVIDIDNEIDNLNIVIASINNYAHSLETRVANNENEISAIKQVLDGFNTDVDTKLLELEIKLTNLINSKVINVDAQILELRYKVNSIRVELQKEIDELKDRMDDIDTSVKNPWHDRFRVSQDQNAKYIYSDLADAVPTAEEYASLGLTASEYSAYELTAKDYAEFGKKKLHLYWCFSPVYGFKQNISNVLTSIVNVVMGTLSATQYTALDLTADEYTALDLTAEEYYSYNTNGINLTANEYSNINVLNSGILRV